MKRILVIKNLNILTFILILPFWSKRIKVFYYQSFGLFLKPFVNNLLKKMSINRIDLESCDDINFQPILGSKGDYTDQVLFELMSADHLATFKPFFKKIKNIDGKLSLLVKKFVIFRCRDLYNISMWLNGVSEFRHNHKVFLLWDICSIGNGFILKSCQNIDIKIIAYSDFFIFFDFVKKASIICFKKIAQLLKKLFILKRKKDVKESLKSVMSDGIDTASFEILFFPHQSIFYGDLFIKDYFYSDEKTSVFNIKNILHVEFSSLFLDDDKANFYNDNCITTVLFPKPKLKEYLKNFRYVISSIGFVNSLMLLKRNALLFFILLFNTVIFLTKKKVVNSSFPSAKIVLVGYEILFPPIISLLFESLSIKTVAVQERFMASAIFENWPFFIDTYYSSSNFVCKKIEQSNSKFVNQCIPCGQMRTDLLERLSNKDSDASNLIVVFDLHSEEDPYKNMLLPGNNWLANESFYNDICKLANRFKDFNIVIRGKNINWTKIAFFKDVLELINSIPNLSISKDYNSYGMQYKLASNAKLIIAKHSSIGDEAIASGKPVIFHDFSPNFSKAISREYDYDNSDIFVYSYDELELKVKSIVEDNYYLKKSKLIELQEIINNRQADGKATDRVMSNLNALYIEDNK
jgi:hypothetical protein